MITHTKSIFLFIWIILGAHWASAQDSSPNVGEIIIDDFVKDGCWTNIVETRQYLHDKINESSHGFMKKEDKFRLLLMGNRDAGYCSVFGVFENYSILSDLYMDQKGAPKGNSRVIWDQRLFVMYDAKNINVQILNYIQSIF